MLMFLHHGNSWHASAALPGNGILIHGGFDGENAMMDAFVFHLGKCKKQVKVSQDYHLQRCHFYGFSRNYGLKKNPQNFLYTEKGKYRGIPSPKNGK